MAKFYGMGNYTAKAFQGFIKDPGQDRSKAVEAVANSLGAKVHGFDLLRGPYDFLAEGQEYLEDLNKLNLYVTKEFVNGFTLSLRGENLTDEVVEVVPFYNTEGREIYLTLGYTW